MRYRLGARYYRVLSGERLLYSHGRRAAVELLNLREGDRVLDVGCGTGLNFPLLVDRIGPRGAVVGIDASGPMLRQAERRASTRGWPQVTVLHGDAAALDPAVLTDVDAVLFTYSLAVIDDWRSAWRRALAGARPGARVAVADSATPTGPWRALAPLARLAFAVGGVHPSRRVWEAVLADTADARHVVLTGGHVHVAAGTVRRPDGPGQRGHAR